MLIPVGEQVVSVGVSGSNILGSDAPQPITQKLLEARLRGELRKGSPPKASESDITRDWNLLQKAMNSPDIEEAARFHRPQQLTSQSRPERTGNQP
jgi:hypothetical protein